MQPWLMSGLNTDWRMDFDYYSLFLSARLKYCLCCFSFHVCSVLLALQDLHQRSIIFFPVLLWRSLFVFKLHCILWHKIQTTECHDIVQRREGTFTVALAWNQLLLSTTLDYERTLTEKVIVSFYQGWHQDSGSRGVDMTYISAKHREKWSLQRAPSWTQLCTGRRGLLITQLLVFNKSCGEVCSKMLLGLPCKKVFWDWKVLLLHRNFVGGGPKWLKFHSIWKRMKEIYCHSNKM